jgi:hypothetical protein
MNIIDCIDGNLHLKTLFPNGIVGDILLGQIGFDVDGRISLNIHTRQKPAIEVAKWGKWGEQFNVIVVRLLGRGGDHVAIRNWRKAEFKTYAIGKNEDTFLISQHGEDWDIELTFSSLLFQGYDVYTD